jgi:hypothetical protein
MADIKESLELVALVGSLADCLIEAKRDGVVSWFDLPKFAPVVGAAKRALDGSDFIDDELKDLSAEEAQALAKSSLEAALKLVDAVLKK